MITNSQKVKILIIPLNSSLLVIQNLQNGRLHRRRTLLCPCLRLLRERIHRLRARIHLISPRHATPPFLLHVQSHFAEEIGVLRLRRHRRFLHRHRCPSLSFTSPPILTSTVFFSFIPCPMTDFLTTGSGRGSSGFSSRRTLHMAQRSPPTFRYWQAAQRQDSSSTSLRSEPVRGSHREPTKNP